MVNKVFREHIEELNNKELIFEEIITREKRKNNTKKRILNIATTFLIAITIGVTSSQIYAKIQWNIQFEEYQNNTINLEKGSLEKAKEDGYSEVINMDFIEKEGISIKVDSMLITDDCFDANITFKFDENIIVNSENFTYGYVVYDENKNIYGIWDRRIGQKGNKDNMISYIYKDIGIEYNRRNIYGNMLAHQLGTKVIKSDPSNRTIISNLNITTRKSFPKSKKIYIKIFDPGYTMFEISSDKKRVDTTEDFSLSKYIWSFEIEVPEKFYERETVQLKPESDIPGIEIQDITITETGMVLNFKSEEYNKMIFKGKDMPSEEFSRKQNEMLNISDETGKVYYIKI